MGRVFIPRSVFEHQVLPFERLIRGLAEALQPPHRRQEDDSACREQCDDKERCCMFPRATFGCPRSTPWFGTSVQLGRYRAPEVNVKVEHGKVVLHARREDRHGDDFDISETQRTVELPQGVDAEKVLCFLRPDGRVVIKAPFVGKKDTAPSPQANTACKKVAQAPKKDTRSEEATETEKTNTKAVASTVNGGDDQKTMDCYSAKTVEIGASDVSTADKKPTDNHAEADKKEADDQELPVEGNFQKSLAVNADDEQGVEKLILDEDENASVASLDDFLFVDNRPVKTTENFEQETEVAEPDTRDETKVVLSDADQKLRPLADSVRIVEDGQKKKFEVSLNLKDFDTENMSVRFIDNDLFIDAKKETTEDGNFSMCEVHRKYTVPETGILDSARAQISGDGMVKVSVPLAAEETVETITVPIVQLK